MSKRPDGTYDNVDSGTLGRNDRKEQSWHSDLKGKAEIRCPRCGHTSWRYLDGYTRESAQGKFISIKIGAEFEPQRRYEAKGRAHTPQTQQYAAELALSDGPDQDLVRCIGPNGNATELPRKTAQNLGLEILPEANAQPDKEIPW